MEACEILKAVLKSTKQEEHKFLKGLPRPNVTSAANHPGCLLTSKTDENFNPRKNLPS